MAISAVRLVTWGPCPLTLMEGRAEGGGRGKEEGTARGRAGWSWGSYAYLRPGAEPH